MSSSAVVVGNGTSRAGQPLANCRWPMVGCNAAWRELPLRSIVSVDYRGHDITDPAPMTKVRWFVGRPEVYEDSKCVFTADGAYGWCAGRTAIHYTALKYQPSSLYLVGFDFGSADGSPNNLYHDEPLKRHLDRFAEEFNSLPDDLQLWLVGDGTVYEEVKYRLPMLRPLTWQNFWRRHEYA